MFATGVYTPNSAHTILGRCELRASTHEGLGRLTPPLITSQVATMLAHPRCGIYRCGDPCLLAIMITVDTVATDADLLAIVR